MHIETLWLVSWAQSSDHCENCGCKIKREAALSDTGKYNFNISPFFQIGEKNQWFLSHSCNKLASKWWTNYNGLKIVTKERKICENMHLCRVEWSWLSRMWRKVDVTVQTFTVTHSHTCSVHKIYSVQSRVAPPRILANTYLRQLTLFPSKRSNFYSPLLFSLWFGSE